MSSLESLPKVTTGKVVTFKSANSTSKQDCLKTLILDQLSEFSTSLTIDAKEVVIPATAMGVFGKDRYYNITVPAKKGSPPTPIKITAVATLTSSEDLDGTRWTCALSAQGKFIGDRKAVDAINEIIVSMQRDGQRLGKECLPQLSQTPTLIRVLGEDGVALLTLYGLEMSAFPNPSPVSTDLNNQYKPSNNPGSEEGGHAWRLPKFKHFHGEQEPGTSE